MLVAQTSAGVARVGDGVYELLDVGAASLSSLISAGAVDRLDGARVTAVIDEEEVTLEAPVSRPGKIVIVGLNYADHAAETGVDLPEIPRIFLAAGSAVIGPYDDIPLPRIAASAVDFEGEMAVVIGLPASDVLVNAAWSYVAGVTGANDVSARDVQNGTNSAVAGANVGLAKAFDGFKPLGPALLTAGDMQAGRQLRLRTLVDGQVRQDSSTAQMHFPVAELVSTISRYTTLLPGDVVLTGTPAGTGFPTGRFLKAGQVVEVALEGVGMLRNRVVTPTPGRGSVLHIYNDQEVQS